MEERLNLIFKNYLREHLLTKDEVRKMRAKLKKVYQSKETMIETMKNPEIPRSIAWEDVTNISDESFQIIKDRTFKCLDDYEASLKE